MNVQDILAADRLSDAIATQRTAVESNVIDYAARLSLFELLVIAGRFLDAHAELKRFEEGAPEFRDYAKSLRKLLRAERRRQHGFKPALLSEPPMHVRCRWHAVKASRIPDEAKALKWADRAEAKTPIVRGHVNGREFTGIRDADDRFAGLLEFLMNGRYHWVPFEQIKKLTLGHAVGMLDTVLRPAELILHGRSLALRADKLLFRGHVPLVYPGTALAGKDESFALGKDADFTDVAGLVVGIGERVLAVGEEEIPLGEIQQLEIKK